MKEQTFTPFCRLKLLPLIYLGVLLFGIRDAEPNSRGCIRVLSAFSAEAAPSPQIHNFSELLASKRPMIVAHGKNENIAEESTWPNYLYSVYGGAHVLEFDVWNTSDGHPILFHDPTFHRIVKDYHTSHDKIAAFWRDHFDLAKQKQWDWDFNLFDRVSSEPLEAIRRHRLIFDRHSGNHFPVITLDEMLSAIEQDTIFQTPAYVYLSERSSETRSAAPMAVRLLHPLFYYIDFKEAIFLGRVVDGQPLWDWQRAKWSYDQLHEFTFRSIEALVRVIQAHHSQNRCFIVVRHPLIAQMFRKIDPSVRLMASSDRLIRTSSAEDVASEMRRFEPYAPELFEIKYLNHITSPKIRRSARTFHLKLLFDEIIQTDPTQFMRPYEGNLDRLLDDIFENGANILLQTNTVHEVLTYISRYY